MARQSFLKEMILFVIPCPEGDAQRICFQASKMKATNGRIRLLHLKFTITVSLTRISCQHSNFPLLTPQYQVYLLPQPQLCDSHGEQGHGEEGWLPGYVQLKV